MTGVRRVEETHDDLILHSESYPRRYRALVKQALASRRMVVRHANATTRIDGDHAPLGALYAWMVS